MIESENRIDVIELIYKLYIFCMPFSLFSFVNQDAFLVKYFFFSPSCLFLYIGILLIIISNHGELPFTHLIGQFFKLYAFMTLYSVIAACVQYASLGTKYGENTFDCIGGDIVFYFVVLLNIYFNYYCLSYVITLNKLFRVLWADLTVLLILGYIQLFTIIGFRPASAIYQFLQRIFSLYSLSGNHKGVTFFGSELSSASSLYVMLIPFLLSWLTNNNNLEKPERRKATVYLLLFIPLFLSNQSSSVYIGLLLLFITLISVKTNRSSYIFLLLIGTIIGISIVIIFGTNIITTISNQFEDGTIGYILFGKALDISNLSTAMRFSGMGMFIYIFTHYPITGVGNGIQGFYYEAGLQDWARESNEVQYILAGNSGVPNGGGAFYTAFLTGYGVIGTSLLVYCCYCAYKELILKKDHLDRLYYLFLFGFVVFNFEAWTVMGIKQNLNVMFLLSIPFIDNDSIDGVSFETRG